MILGSRKVDTELKALIRILDDDISELVAAQKETNRLLQELVHANRNFVCVIENFFAVEKKLHIEEARRKEKRAMDLEPAEADLRY
jgi:hypothetical protein